MRTRSRIVVTVIVLTIVAAAVATIQHYRRNDLGYVLAHYGPAARARMKPYFDRAKVAYPPQRLALLIFKREKRLSVWAGGSSGGWRFVRAYPILAASGTSGPKLREGDYQVPEGLYRIEVLNPASSYHLSMRVGYPNAADRKQAAIDHRTRLGGDIYIHGKNLSIGCVAIGDTAIEELFTLVADTGTPKVQLILSPNDLRVASAPITQTTPLWIVQLYQTIAAALVPFPIEMEANSAFDVRPGVKWKVLPVK